MKAKADRGRGPIEISEEAFHLLRMAPLSAFFAYYLGAIPFALALLYFWSDMSRGTFADERLAMETSGLTLLFIGMKCCQAIFARQLRAQLIGHPAPRLTFRKIWRIGINQAILQPLGLFLIPIALLLLFPIGWVYAFFQNATVLGGNDEYDLQEIVQKSLKQAALWPLQNNYLVFMFKGFSIFVLLNVGSGIVMAIYFLSMFLGIQTAFSQSPSAFLNTTFLASLCALTYLCIDPVLKAVYVLRCFYGESRQSGEDLKADLRASSILEQKGAAIALSSIILLLSLPHATGAEPKSTQSKGDGGSVAASVKPTQLDEAINRTMQKPEYTWRLPREQKAENEKKGYLASWIDKFLSKIQTATKSLGNTIDRFIRWLTQNQSSSGGKGGLKLDWLMGVKGLIIVLILAIAALLAWLLVRLWKTRNASDIPEIEAEAVLAAPNLEDEHVAADQLPEDGWISMARDLLNRGEPRLALRALYLASLAHLAQRNLITIARFKSNRDYERELSRRAHALPEVTLVFTENVSIFDRSWYGTHEVSAPLLDHFEGNLNKIKAA